MLRGLTNGQEPTNNSGCREPAQTAQQDPGTTPLESLTMKRILFAASVLAIAACSGEKAAETTPAAVTPVVAPAPDSAAMKATADSTAAADSMAKAAAAAPAKKTP